MRSILLFSTIVFFVQSIQAQSNHTAKRISYNNPGLTVDLGVGLWAIPLPMDFDDDGDSDLIVSTNDVPYNGLYFFENVGKEALLPGVKIGKGQKNISVSHVNGEPIVSIPGIQYQSFKRLRLQNETSIPYTQDFYSGRTNQWKFADYDGDNLTDLIFGVSDWQDYGWDNAYDENGIWTNGKIHGYIYWAKNVGTNGEPNYNEAIKVEADGSPINVYGCPSPNFADMDGDGDLDLITGEFLDRISYFENIGGRSNPQYTNKGFLEIDGETLHLELQMLQVSVFDWDQDQDFDIIIGKEDGRVLWLEHLGMDSNNKVKISPPKYFKQYAADVKCGALVTPCSVDWDGDGDEDLICGNTAGFIEWIENLGGVEPKWNAPQRLVADGEVIRYLAGENLSIQGPAEAKWGYTVPYVADWNMDDLPDIIVNTIIGKIEWYENIGSRTQPVLAAAKPIPVVWEGSPPKPAWNWWNPVGHELVVQWRTRPIVYDLNQDAIQDLIVIDHEGYLSYFEQSFDYGDLMALPGKRVFKNEDGNPLQLNDGIGGRSGRRKIDLTDWDGDGDMDLLINSPRTSPEETRNISWYENINQSGIEITFRFGGDITEDRLEGHTTSPTTVDWNGDGIRDLLVGGEDGFLYLYQRDSSDQVIVK